MDASRTTSPLVSVVVPNYNHARYLRERLDTIFGQTFQDFELVFLDDASTDGSRGVFAPYARDARVRAVFNEANGGSVFRQWNRGLAMSTGKYVWIAESDDASEPEFLATMVERLERDPRPLLHVGGFRLHPRHRLPRHDERHHGTAERHHHRHREQQLDQAEAVRVRVHDSAAEQTVTIWTLFSGPGEPGPATLARTTMARAAPA